MPGIFLVYRDLHATTDACENQCMLYALHFGVDDVLLYRAASKFAVSV
jgi:hypothetical protein